MNSNKKKIGWGNHKWAIATIASILSGVLIQSFFGASTNAYSILYFLPKGVNVALVVISYLIAAVIFAKHVFLKKKEVTSLEKVLQIIALILFVLAVTDRVILTVASDITVASTAETHRDLDFFTTMVYLVIKNYRTFLVGILHTLELAFVGTIVGFLLALLLVFCRTQKPNERDSEPMQALKLLGNAFGAFYVTIIRGTPMMVQGLIIYYAGFRLVKNIFPSYSISQLNAIYSVFFASSVTVSLNTTAYITEILRGSVEAIDKGQTEAARSLGMSSWQTMMNVVFPQAIKNSIPAICNEFIINVKDTSVLNAVGMTEMMFMTTTVAGTYYKYLETYMITAVIYLFLTILLQALMNRIAKRFDMPAQHGVPSSN